MDELLNAVLNINTKKAPGPEQIPPLIIKEISLENPEIILRVFNEQLRRRNVPRIWKEAAVALIPKAKKSEQKEMTFRPLCLLNTMGKLYEKMILNRLMEEIKRKELISKRQYGFTPGKSTIQAAKEVTELAKEELTKTWRTRKHCLLIALDIKNAFNSAPWRQIILALEEKKVSRYLINIIKTYLDERELVGEEFTKFMTAGVPQGSTAGATLWNIMYDGVLRLRVEDGVHLISYADDLAVVVKARTETELEDKTKKTLDKIFEWMTNTGLEIAPEKRKP